MNDHSRKNVLEEENFPVKYMEFVSTENYMDELECNDTITIDEVSYETIQCIGKGCFGKVYKSKTSKDDKLVALKVTDRRLGLWETYIAKALQTRSPPEARPWFMNIEAALFSANRSFLISDICRHGTLSDLFKSQHFKNHVKIQPLVLHFGSVLLNILDSLQKAKIIHADLHGSNIMIMPPRDGSLKPDLQLIDFAFAIDVSKYDENKTFREEFVFTKTIIGQRHWSFDLDILYIANCIWTMLTPEIVGLHQVDSLWVITDNPSCGPLDAFWKPLLQELLNAKPNSMPDLMKIKQDIEKKLDEMVEEANQSFKEFSDYMRAGSLTNW